LTHAGPSPTSQIAIITIQLQIPDHLYREAKRIAADYEMTFSEIEGLPTLR